MRSSRGAFSPASATRKVITAYAGVGNFFRIDLNAPGIRKAARTGQRDGGVIHGDVGGKRVGTGREANATRRRRA